MVVNEFYAWGVAGMIGALLWQSFLPFLEARKKAEANGEKPPSFAKEYATTALISAITGLIATFMAADTFEKTIVNAQSIMIAAGMGFAFVYTVLGIGNQIVDLKRDKRELQTRLKDMTITLPPEQLKKEVKRTPSDEIT